MADDAAFFKMQIFASTTMRLWNDNKCDKRMLEKKFENSILYPLPVCIGPVECCSRYGIWWLWWFDGDNDDWIDDNDNHEDDNDDNENEDDDDDDDGNDDDNDNEDDDEDEDDDDDNNDDPKYNSGYTSIRSYKGFTAPFLIWLSPG